MANNTTSSKQFCTDYDKRGQASCKRCKQKLAKGSFRIGKIASNPFSDTGGDMKQWYHPNCIFEAFASARATTAKITALTDVDGYQALNDADRDNLEKLIENLKGKTKCSPKKSPKKEAKIDTVFSPSPSKSPAAASSSGGTCPDELFSSFCELCERIGAESSYKNKTAIANEFLYRRAATANHGFCGDTYILLRLLLPGEKGIERVFNLNNKQIIKIFADLFGVDGDEILSETTEHGDISVVLADNYFTKSNMAKPAGSCKVTIADVDKFLESLTTLTKYDEQLAAFRKFYKALGAVELRYLIRLLKKDLRMNAKASHILAAVSDKAYEAFQHSRNLKAICSYVTASKSPSGSPGLKRDLSVKASLMQPVQPMLAEACRSVEFAFSKCSNGMLAEIKYDGERVQVHHSGNKFNYYSRSLKPVLPHKVSYLSEAIPKAFPSATDLILDGEIVLVDTKTHVPLPFGTLGIHKRKAFQTAQVCLFIFDCMFMNGKSLMHMSIIERRKALTSVMTEIQDRIVLSEVHHITKTHQLHSLLDHVFTEGLEGLVLKPNNSVYEPGKRHWLKMKKDYLNSGAMADTADLIVLGAYFGSGNKGGLMSIFLMGVYDAARKKFLTVTKCGNGLDDATLGGLQKQLDMVRINKDPSKVPSWLAVKNALVPDFVVRDPKKAPIWEITGAEFSKAEVHTADGISIRFPRVTRIRDDKDWQTATNLEELKILQQNSRQQAPTVKSLSKLAETKKPEKRKSDQSVKKKKVPKKIDSDSDSDSTISYEGDEDEPSTSTADIGKSKTPSPPKKPKVDAPSSSRVDWQPRDLFKNCHFYFDSTSIKPNDTHLSILRCAKAYGAASICESAKDAKITHFVVADSCPTAPDMGDNAKCVQMKWMAACVEANTVVDTAGYTVE